MANEVNFQEEDPLVPSSNLTTKSKPSFAEGSISFIISTGIVKTQKGAEYVLLGLIVVVCIVAIGIQVVTSPQHKSPSNINFYVEQMKAEAH